MNKKLINFLIKNYCFTTVVTALRGPDNKDKEAKRDGASILRWALGVNYGLCNPPSEWFLTAVGSLFPPEKWSREPRHYWVHVGDAVRALRAIAPEEFPSRIPLSAYFDAEEACLVAIDVLSRARKHLMATAPNDRKAIKLLDDLWEKVQNGDPPKLRLSGSRRKRGVK